ncbi:uncharacterized protein LOC124460805 [Drosophila willistoni]|uniref:uncharacterized protein LOC124460805 n=1 Tax=Drosophila willistoni TaxID=7260 RepID=UPI001F072ADF|nr:uncharacterized protein LOC124460805 [Drosophila willistoni]
MPKENYKQKVRDVWLQSSEFKEWLRKDLTDLTRAYCSYCKCSINAKLCDLRVHAISKKHTGALNAFAQKNKIEFKKMPTKTIEQEVALCLFVAKHTAISPVDHLSNICSTKFDDSSSASRIKLHRTKCTHIIKNVLAVHFYDDLHRDIGDKKFSLLLDESTDISFTKLLGVVVNYFSAEHGVVVSTFLSLIPVESGDALSKKT